MSKIIGGFSKTKRLRSTDWRTSTGRYLRQIEAELCTHVGTPSFAQRILITEAAVLATRLWLLRERVLDGANLDTDAHQFV